MRLGKPERLQLLRTYYTELAEVNYKTLYILIQEKLRMMSLQWEINTRVKRVGNL